MIVFDGYQLAQQKERQLAAKITAHFSQSKLVIAAILFTQDTGSRLYTRLKGEAAARVGIEYRVFEFSVSDPVVTIQEKLDELGTDPEITGIIIQKPWRKTWKEAQSESVKQEFLQDSETRKKERAAYEQWWQQLTVHINPTKDVDGLHPTTIGHIATGKHKENKRVLPATCQAVITIFDQAASQLSALIGPENTRKIFDGKYIIIGKSDLLGIPLFYELLNQNKTVELIASKQLQERMQSGQKLLDAAVVITATGISGLITADMIAQGSVVIDVGEPKPDVDFAAVSQKTAFITPVPGGVGPLTVISLLENCVELAIQQQS